MSSFGSGVHLQPSRAWRILRIVVAALAFAVTVTWAVTLFGRGETESVWPALPMLLVVATTVAWRGFEGGRLGEQGSHWWLEEPARRLPARPGSLVVALDLGRWMLLRFHPDGARRVIGDRWIALSHADMPADWRAFRRAVYSPRPVPAGPSAQAPADPPHESE